MGTLLFRLGLRGRVVILLLATFGALMGIFVWQALDLRATAIAGVKEHLLNEARLIAARQQAITAQADALLSSLMRHPELRSGTPARACIQTLADQLKDDTPFINLGWVSPDGKNVCSAVMPSEVVNFADRAWFRQALKSRGMVASGVLAGRIVGKPIIAFAKAVRDESGRAVGVLYLAYDLDWLHGQLQHISLPERGRLVVLDKNGTVVVRHPDPEGLTGRKVANPTILQALAARAEGLLETEGMDGVTRFFAYTSFLDTSEGRMSLIVNVPREVVLAPSRRALALSLGIALGVLALALALVYWGSERLMLKPLLAISRQLDRYAAGDLTVRSGLPHGDDEIGRLARILDDTADRVETGAQRMRAVAEASLDALFILDRVRGEDGRVADFEFADVNARAEAMLGMAREQIVGQRLCELLPFCLENGLFDKYAAVAESGVPQEAEFAVDSPRLKAKWLRQQVVRVGEGIAITSRDVTLWKEAAAQIHRQDEQRKLILKAAGEGIFGLDAEGRATFVNPAACAMLQRGEEELIGQLMHPLHHHTRADGTPCPLEECLIFRTFRDGVVHSVSDDLFWRKDGSSFPAEYISTPMLDESGKVIGAVVSFSDISERKAHERSLARALRALKALSTANHELIRASEEQALLHAICGMIVDQGGYRLAWVGYAEDKPGKTVAVQAWAGINEGYLEQLDLTWDDDPERGQGPLCRTLRTGEAHIVRDIRTDPGFAPWRALAQERGFASNLTLPLKAGGKVIGALSIYAAETDAFDAGEVDLLAELGEDLSYGIESLRTRAERDRIAWEHAHHAEILQKSLEQSIQAIAGTVEARDPYTAGHQRRVAELAVAIAREMGLDEQRIRGIRLAASVHDLGKIQIPAEILSKPTQLSEIEFMLIKTHPQAGYEILKDIEFPWPIAEIVRQHHERMDGSGYPQGLKGSEILLESRIMAVADLVEAMSSHRPYRPSLGVEPALAEAERRRGSAYDAAVVDACLRLFREKGFKWQT